MTTRTTIVTLLLFAMLQACNTTERNELEKKIEGNWTQSDGIGAIANMGIKFDYTFKDNSEFIQKVIPSSTGDVVYSNWPNKEGIFRIESDSLMLYIDNNTTEAFYKAKIEFVNNNKFNLYDLNGQLTYDRKD